MNRTTIAADLLYLFGYMFIVAVVLVVATRCGLALLTLLARVVYRLRGGRWSSEVAASMLRHPSSRGLR